VSNCNPARLKIFLAQRAALIDLAAPITGCRSRAEDVVQEAYFRFCTRDSGAGAREPIANPIGYLFRIVRNLALDWTRRPTSAPVSLEAEALDRLAAASPTPEDTALFRDELRALGEALDELPERTRNAFIMHRVEGLSLAEVAVRLNVSTVRAHQLVRQAILHGAARLEARLPEPGRPKPSDDTLNQGDRE
jgi:RNA polymerase sigma-70 factor (ECF subfamily)